MSEEKISEVQEPIEQSSDPETETPLKTPKKKFIMTPARLENLRKGREKRAENVRKKKEVEAQLKEEEKTKKAEIKKRVEAELSRRDNESEPEPEPESAHESEPIVEKKVVKPRKVKSQPTTRNAVHRYALNSVQNGVARGSTESRRVCEARVSHEPNQNQHVVVFI